MHNLEWMYQDACMQLHATYQKNDWRTPAEKERDDFYKNWKSDLEAQEQAEQAEEEARLQKLIEKHPERVGGFGTLKGVKI